MFLIFASGFSLLVYFMERGKWWRRFALFSLALAIATILWLGIRGELFGIVAGILVFWGLWSWWHGSKKARIGFVLGCGLLAIFAAGIFFLRASPAADYYPNVVRRIVNLPNESSFQTRLLSLQSSWRAFTDSPKTMLIGWGQEHFMTGYNKYYDPRHGTVEDAWFDRAHNKIADVAVTGGIVGLVTYLALFGILGWYLAHIAKRGGDSRKIVIACVALLVAYFAQNLAIFDLPQTYVNFFLLMAFLDWLWADGRTNGAPLAHPHSARRPDGSTLRVLVGALGTAALLAREVAQGHARGHVLDDGSRYRQLLAVHVFGTRLVDGLLLGDGPLV